MKRFLVVLVIVLVVIQFFRPAKNSSDIQTFHVSNNYAIPAGVNSTWENACNDCHSNKTDYPWYASVQPVAWWMNGHITDGKRHLNLSEFTRRPLAWQHHKFEEIVEMVEEGEMPLPSYTWMGMHDEANLSEEEKKALVDWAKQQMADMKAKYPADSLIMKRRAPQPGS